MGVNLEALSEKISLDYWGDVLPESWDRAALFIKFLRRTPGMGSSHTYTELEKLVRKWRD